MEQLRPALGYAHFYRNVTIFGTAIGPIHLVVAQPADAASDAWYIASNELTHRQTLDEYGLRFDIEENFLDEKSDGFQVQTSKLQTPEALEALSLGWQAPALEKRMEGAGRAQGLKRERYISDPALGSLGDEHYFIR